MPLLEPNVGNADAWIRRALGVVLILGSFFVASRLPAEWFLTVMLHPTILGGYLLLSSVSRECFFYHARGVSTADARTQGPEAIHRAPRPPRTGRGRAV